MTTPQELVQALRESKAKVAQLREKLDAIDREKEQWFSSKRDFSAQIKSLIQQIKDLRGKRDSLTHDVKGFKQKREAAQKELKHVAPEIKEHPIDRELLRKRPESIKTLMDRIETTIETSGISFEKEKELMKKLKTLKKEYNEVAFARAEAKESRELHAKAHDLGKEAESFHMLVVHKAGESQKVHHRIIGISKQIDELKIKEKEALGKFLECKKQFGETYAPLKSGLEEMHKIKSQLDAMDAERSKLQWEKKNQSLKQLKESVEQKIKGKKKLTNQDLIIFQKSLASQERRR